MSACRVVLFVCALCVLMCCVVAAMAADMSLKEVAVAADSESAGAEEKSAREILEYYEDLFKNASAISGQLFMVLQTIKSLKLNSKITSKTDVHSALRELDAKLKFTKELTERSLRPMGAGQMDKKLKHINKTVADGAAGPELLMMAEEMMVSPETVETAINAVKQTIAEADKLLKLMEQNENMAKERDTFKYVTTGLENSLNILEETKSAAEEAEKWQDRLFAVSEEQQIEDEEKDEPQKTEAKKKERLQQEQSSVLSAEKENDKRPSVNGSVTTASRCAVFFVFVFVFITVSAVISEM